MAQGMWSNSQLPAEISRYTRWAVMTILMLLVAVVFAQPSAAACFRIMDATLYTGKPDLSQYGIQRATLVEPQRWWKNAKVDAPGRHEVTVQNARELSNNHGLSIIDPLVIDLELPQVGSDPSSDQNIQPFLDVVSGMREGGYDRPLAFYATLPLRDYWRAQKAGTPAYRAWQAENDRVSKIVPLVSALYPSLYTFYNDQAGWVRYAEANVAEAKRIGKGRPVYPFLWPQYHDSARELAGQYLSRDYWLQELRTMARVADGLVIWGGWDNPNVRTEPWDDSAPWWQATKEFIKSQPNVCAAK
jgi:Hyaluronidase